MLKVKIRVGSTYVGCPTETKQYLYPGTKEEFNKDEGESIAILDMILNGDFPHTFVDIDTEGVPDDENGE